MTAYLRGIQCTQTALQQKEKEKKKKISGIKGIKMKERGSRLKRFFERFFEDFMESLCWNSDTQTCHMSTSELISLNIMIYTGWRE